MDSKMYISFLSPPYKLYKLSSLNQHKYIIFDRSIG